MWPYFGFGVGRGGFPWGGGRGHTWGGGLGRMWRTSNFGYVPQALMPPFGFWGSPENEQVLAALKNQAEILKKEIKAIQDRIEELEKTKQKTEK